MCQVPSWITQPDGTVLYLTDKDAKAHGIEWNDATGHSAIRRVWPGAKGEEGEGLGRDTPPEVVRSLLSAGMNAIAAAGVVLVRDGEWELPVRMAWSVEVRQGATLTALALARAGSVEVHQGATLTAPALSEVSGYVVARPGATLIAPALAEVGGSVEVHQGATLTAPVLAEVSGYVVVDRGGVLDAPKLNRRGGHHARP